MLLGLQPGRQRFKKHLICIPLNYKLEEANKGKNCKTTASYVIVCKNYDWSWQEERVLVKQGSVELWNSCIVTRGQLETTRLQLADIVLNRLVVFLCLVQFEESSTSLWCRNVSETRISMADQLHFCMPELWLLHYNFSVIISSFWSQFSSGKPLGSTLLSVRCFCPMDLGWTWPSKIVLQGSERSQFQSFRLGAHLSNVGPQGYGLRQVTSWLKLELVVPLRDITIGHKEKIPWIVANLWFTIILIDPVFKHFEKQGQLV